MSIIASGNERIEVKPGSHTFPFSFTLPKEIPASYEGAHGNVRYTVQGVMKRSLLKKDYFTDVVPFTVNNSVSFNKGTVAVVYKDRK